jgi:hypothetical protein
MEAGNEGHGVRRRSAWR